MSDSDRSAWVNNRGTSSEVTFIRCIKPCDEGRCPNLCGYAEGHAGEHACTPWDVQKAAP